MDKMVELLIKVYKEGSGIIDNTACKHCPKRKNGECPLADKDFVPCPMSDAEAVDLFIKYGLEEN